MVSLPKISVVTPSYNQGQYLEQTILSVLGQNYPNLEFIVIDGGSTDNSIEILKKYDQQITYWVSEKDDGQAQAINKGFEKATGDVLCWLNSDDMFMPGVLMYIASNIDIKKSQIFSGNCIHFSDYGENGLRTQECDIIAYSKTMSLFDADYITQPSTFWTRRTWIETGILNENYHFVFDWEWFLRAKQNGTTFIFNNRALSLYREHPTYKTGTGGEKRKKEFVKLFKQFNQHENAWLIEQLINDKPLLKSRKAALLRYLFRIFRLKYNEIELLRILTGNKYKKIDKSKFSSIFYAV